MNEDYDALDVTNAEITSTVDGEDGDLSVDQINAAIEALARANASKANEIGAQLSPMALIATKIDLIAEELFGAEDIDRAVLDLRIQQRISVTLDEAKDAHEEEERKAKLAVEGVGGLILPEGAGRPNRQARRREARQVAKRIVDGKL